jgi:hypothetical protein
MKNILPAATGFLIATGLCSAGLVWALTVGFYVPGTQVKAIAAQMAYADPIAVIAGRE